jgi:transmembrane sensor
MNAPDTAIAIDEQAARWAARLDRAALSVDETARLEAWLAQEPRARGALLKAEATLSLLDRARALNVVIPVPECEPVFERRRFLIAAGAFGAFAVGIGGAAIWLRGPRRYSTETGEVRRVPLADGSVVAINTESAIVVEIKPDLRQIRLTRGEAWFQVAKDASRPFVVEAGRARVRAVGTAFSVRRREGGADVLVTEGTVEIWSIGEEGQGVLVSAGAKAFIADYEPPKPIAASMNTIDRTLAWRDGQIALEGETLADAVSEFNRYNAKKLVIEDADLAQERLVGQFRTTEPDEFARAVESAMGAVTSTDGSTIRIGRAPKK